MLQLTTPFCLWTLSLLDSLVIPRVVARCLEASRQTFTLLPQSTRGRLSGARQSAQSAKHLSAHPLSHEAPMRFISSLATKPRGPHG
jgi:hypothetical protein